jgi:hypothetical protein
VYSLQEYWSRQVGKKSYKGFAREHEAGCITGGLAAARAVVGHRIASLVRMLPVAAQTFPGPRTFPSPTTYLHGTLIWQRVEEMRPAPDVLTDGQDWAPYYASHVAGHAVVETLNAARTWLLDAVELRRRVR